MFIAFAAIAAVAAAVSFICGYQFNSDVAYIIGAAAAVSALISAFAYVMRRKSYGKNKFKLRGSVPEKLARIDEMSGLEFEQYAAYLLESDGYENVSLTQGSHDQGADILMERESVRFAVQCKVYSTRLGNTPVQEITAAREFYDCHVGVVITNSYFTDGAVALAKANRILLWDRAALAAMLDRNM